MTAPGSSRPNGRPLRQLLCFLLILVASAGLALNLGSPEPLLTRLGLALVLTGMLLGLVTP